MKYTKKQITEAIAYWKKQLNEMTEGMSYNFDETDGPIVTVGDLKKILAHFKDTDVIDICDKDGDPGHKVVAIWNSDYERDMTNDAESKDNACYIRIA